MAGSAGGPSAGLPAPAYIHGDYAISLNASPSRPTPSMISAGEA